MLDTWSRNFKQDPLLVGLRKLFLSTVSCPGDLDLSKNLIIILEQLIETKHSSTNLHCLYL